MTKDLIVAAIQFDIAWEQPEINLNRLDEILSQLTEVDLIILPEMFTTGFTMNPWEHAEEFHPEMTTLEWMKKTASIHQAAVMGSISIKENGHFRNSLFVAFPDRTFIRYDKSKLFSMGEENKHYISGDTTIQFDWKGWKIKPLICYELRFPELARNHKEEKYDLLIYVANWPEVRRHPWRTLLQARAIENQSYVVGVNRVGADNTGLSHSGDSLIIDPKGSILKDGFGGTEMILVDTISFTELHEFRSKFPVLQDI